MLDGRAADNAVVVRRLLAEQNVEVPLRTLQRVLAPSSRAAQLAKVRFETRPAVSATYFARFARASDAAREAIEDRRR